jgi:hypothetical protein
VAAQARARARRAGRCRPCRRGIRVHRPPRVPVHTAPSTSICCPH